MKINIQSKVGILLGLILLVAFGASGLVATQRTIGVLDNLSEHFKEALAQSGYQQALNVFTSLETGAQGSLERGEMLVFAKLIKDLSSIEGVVEIGLTNPEGTIAFSNIQDRLKSNLETEIFTGATQGGKKVFSQEAKQNLMLARAHYMDADCIRCHTKAQVGDLAGVLFVKYDTHNLYQVLDEVRQIGEEATSSSIQTALLTGLGGLLLAVLGVHFLIGYLVRSPLQRIRDILSGMGSGDFRQSLEIAQQDELGETATSINQMSDQLNHLIARSRKSVEILNNVVVDVDSASSSVKDATLNEQKSLALTLSSMEKVGNSTRLIKEKVDAFEAASSECSSSALEMAASIEEIAISSDQLAETANQVSSAIGQMAGSIQQVSDQAGQMKQTAFETASAIEEMEVSNKEIDKNAHDVAQIAEEVQQKTERGSASLSEILVGINKAETVSLETDQAMSELARQATNIGSIVEVIDEITEQTNLLALNAAIIAAQAGDKGKGFSVVAEEIRELAERTKVSTQEISQAISGIQNVTEKAVHSNRTSHEVILSWQTQSKDFSETLTGIFSQVEDVSEQIRQIAKATMEQSKGTRLIKDSIDNVATMAERSAVESREQSEGAKQIADAANRMQGVTNQVKNATHEQSQNSQFIAKAMEAIKEQSSEVRDLTSEQKEQGEGIIATLSDMRRASEHTHQSVNTLQEAVKATREEADQLDEAMNVFQISEQNETSEPT